MSKFLHRDAMHEEGAPSEAAFTAAERLGIKWPALPWTCPGCGVTRDTHKETVATVDLELVSALHQIITNAPLILSTPQLANLPKSREAIEAFAGVVRMELAAHGPPAVFLCLGCDFANHTAPNVVHVLAEGRTLCGMFGYPSNWPANHKWVRLDEAKDATCIVCRQMIGVREG